MAYDKGLAQRLESYFQHRPEVEVKKMFGGLCFMVNRHMCVGIVGERLMARVGPGQYDSCLRHEHVSEMDFTGKPMQGMIYVEPEGLSEDDELAQWIALCESFVRTLPPK